MAYNAIQFQQGMSLPEFLQSFDTESACCEAVLRARWPNGFACPRCGSAHCVLGTCGMAAVDGLVAELLAHSGAILRLGKAVVVAVPQAAAREFDAQFLKHARHLMVDVLAAVVGVKAQNLERELRQHLLDHAEQVRLGDRLHAGHHLPLGDAVRRGAGGRSER